MRGRSASAQSMKVVSQVPYDFTLSPKYHIVRYWNPAPETSPATSVSRVDTIVVCHLGVRSTTVERYRHLFITILSEIGTPHMQLLGTSTSCDLNYLRVHLGSIGILSIKIGSKHVILSLHKIGQY